MKISTKYRYAVRIALELAGLYGEGPVKRKVLSESIGIPMAYLENILLGMKSAGIVIATRGAGGGLVLSKAPEFFTPYDIINGIGGGESLSIDSSSVYCSDADNQITCKLWKKTNDAFVAILSEKNLQELVDEGKAETLNYMI